MLVLRYVFRFFVVFSVASIIYMLLGCIVFSWNKLICDLLVVAVWAASGDACEIMKHCKTRL